MNKLLFLFLAIISISCAKSSENDDPVVDPDSNKSTVITEEDITEDLYNKYVLLEDYTSASCGWCPYMMDYIESVHDDETFIPIAIQCKFAGDNSFVTKYSSILMNKFKVDGFPTLYVNRTSKYDGENFSTYKNLKSNAGIIIKKTTGEGTTSIHVGITCKESEDGLKLALYFLQDKLIVTQSNYLSGDARFKDSRFFSLPDHIENFEINHVLRSIGTDLFGEDVTTDELYVKEFKFANDVLPSENGSVIAIVTKDDKVVNVRKLSLNE